jgi:hypothetical protein
VSLENIERDHTCFQAMEKSFNSKAAWKSGMKTKGKLE